MMIESIPVEKNISRYVIPITNIIMNEYLSLDRKNKTQDREQSIYDKKNALYSPTILVINEKVFICNAMIIIVFIVTSVA